VNCSWRAIAVADLDLLSGDDVGRVYLAEFSVPYKQRRQLLSHAAYVVMVHKEGKAAVCGIHVQLRGGTQRMSQI
jgi:hypothetical protein